MTVGHVYHTLFTLFIADNQVVIVEDEEDFSYMIKKPHVEHFEYLLLWNDEINDLFLHVKRIKGVGMNWKWFSIREKTAGIKLRK